MKNLLILHGAIGSQKQFLDLSNLLNDTQNFNFSDYKIHLLDFSGHGGSKYNEFDGEFSINNFTNEVVDYLTANNITELDIFGYSMGGYVAINLALNLSKSNNDYPTKYNFKVNKIFTLATKFEWSEEIAAKEVKMLNADKILEKIPKFAEELQKRHYPNDWKVVLDKTANMMIEMGKNCPLKLDELHQISTEIRIAIGDSDSMVTLQETIDVFNNLPNSSLLILPNTPHPIEKVNLERLTYEFNQFF